MCHRASRLNTMLIHSAQNAKIWPLKFDMLWMTKAIFENKIWFLQILKCKSLFLDLDVFLKEDLTRELFSKIHLGYFFNDIVMIPLSPFCGW